MLLLRRRGGLTTTWRVLVVLEVMMVLAQFMVILRADEDSGVSSWIGFCVSIFDAVTVERSPIMAVGKG